HAAGIVHRDFKPQNVIVGPDGRPRVLDFGLARAVQGDEGTQLIAVPQVAGFEPTSGHSLDEAITMAGTVMGTPQYMAPEQFEGSDSTGPAADQFGFCAALWMALYRERPYQGADIPQLVAAACAGTITEPRERHGVPGWLHKVLLRGLATEPRARFASMDELLVALQHDKRSRRRQWVALGVVALASAVGAAGVALALSPSVTSEQRDTVEVLANEARAAAARSYYVYPSPIDAEGGHRVPQGVGARGTRRGGRRARAGGGQRSARRVLGHADAAGRSLLRARGRPSVRGRLLCGCAHLRARQRARPGSHHPHARRDRTAAQQGRRGRVLGLRARGRGLAVGAGGGGRARAP
ncbi:MAG: hypothetical protein K0V04_06430, partial [Deltaproteobacteria bacterium]|nr:hypothetical protein [Deltaproteobacteria bacterium]